MKYDVSDYVKNNKEQLRKDILNAAKKYNMIPLATKDRKKAVYGYK